MRQGIISNFWGVILSFEMSKSKIAEFANSLHPDEVF